MQLQNADSLESKDDDLKQSSFETVVSSVNSSNQYNQVKSMDYNDYSTYSTIGELDIGANRTAGYKNESAGDHQKQTKAIITDPITTPAVTVAMVGIA